MGSDPLRASGVKKCHSRAKKTAGFGPAGNGGATAAPRGPRRPVGSENAIAEGDGRTGKPRSAGWERRHAVPPGSRTRPQGRASDARVRPGTMNCQQPTVCVHRRHRQSTRPAVRARGRGGAPVPTGASRRAAEPARPAVRRDRPRPGDPLPPEHDEPGRPGRPDPAPPNSLGLRSPGHRVRSPRGARATRGALRADRTLRRGAGPRRARSLRGISRHSGGCTQCRSSRSSSATSRRARFARLAGMPPETDWRFASSRARSNSSTRSP